MEQEQYYDGAIEQVQQQHTNRKRDDNYGFRQMWCHNIHIDIVALVANVLKVFFLVYFSSLALSILNELNGRKTQHH